MASISWPGGYRYLQLEQIPRLLAARPAWLRPVVLIDMNTGLRRGEILGLQKQNIDKKRRCFGHSRFALRVESKSLSIKGNPVGTVLNNLGRIQ